MTDALSHRGPDDAGIWLDSTSGIALGHRRLAILDVSPAGHQPMSSDGARFVMAYNGEIYNHLDLRSSLEGEGVAPVWRGHSDTETLLACIVAWGFERALQAAVGMFAIALWDREERTLSLARDRLGEKPLYFGWQGGTFFFGSELKCLRRHPRFSGVVDRGSLALLLRHNCIPAPYSIYEGISKLEPGTYVRVQLQPAAPIAVVPYWSLDAVVRDGATNPFVGSPTDAVDAIGQTLSRSVAGQMLSDVPLGAFLSGGIDSSLVTALMQANSSSPVKTFTIGSEDGNYNEAHHAKAVAEHLGTDHTELFVRPEDALEVIPKLPTMYCEPFGDSSQIPTFLVSQLAAASVTVALSGDGGDEVFGGYNRYLSARRTWSRMSHLPKPVRRLASSALRSVPPATWDSRFARAARILPGAMRMTTPGDKAHKLADVLSASSGQEFYRQLTSHWSDPGSVVIDGAEPPTRITTAAPPGLTSLESWMMSMDTQTYLPDDILVKVDRAAMANSLETRVPLLDHRLVELAWRMPVDLKIRNGEGKWLLRSVLARYVPQELTERPKMGFGIPLGAWLRGPLRDWAEALLSEDRLIDEGYFRPEPIRAMWDEHISGARNWQHHLWTVLMFQAWLETEHAPAA